MQRIWLRAFMRARLLSFETGDAVYVKPTGLNHKSIGKSYWLTDGKKLLHVSEDAFGRNLSQLVKYDGTVKRQQALTAAVQPLLADSMFGTKRLQLIHALVKRSKDR